MLDIAVAAYVEKLWQHTPELRVLLGFARGRDALLLPLWAATLGEIDAAMFDVNDPSVGLTKLAWWGEELASAKPRHPLAHALIDLTTATPVACGDWRALTDAAQSLSGRHVGVDSVSGAIALWTEFAEAQCAIERRLFASAIGAEQLAPLLGARRELGRAMRDVLTASTGSSDAASRMSHPGRAAASAGTEAERFAALLALVPAQSLPSLLWNGQRHILRYRLQRLAGRAATATAITPWRMLLMSWQAAREADLAVRSQCLQPRSPR